MAESTMWRRTDLHDAGGVTVQFDTAIYQASNAAQAPDWCHVWLRLAVPIASDRRIVMALRAADRPNMPGGHFVLGDSWWRLWGQADTIEGTRWRCRAVEYALPVSAIGSGVALLDTIRATTLATLRLVAGPPTALVPVALDRTHWSGRLAEAARENGFGREIDTARPRGEVCDESGV